MQNEFIYFNISHQKYRENEAILLKYMIDNAAMTIIEKYNLYNLINRYVNIITSLLESFSSQYDISYFIGLRGDIDPEDNSEEVIVEIVIQGNYDFNFKKMIWRTIEKYISKIEKSLPENERERSLEHIGIKVI